jgi:hypothetical protein
VIRDHIGSDPVGQRRSRAEVTFVRGSSGACGFEYQLAVVQRVDRSRVDGASLEVPYQWHIDVVGKAKFSLEGRFESIDERVSGRLVEPPVDKLVDLRDEVFSGRIRLEYVPQKAAPERRDRRRRGKMRL